MLKITIENARKWIISASVVYFFFAAISFLLLGVIAYDAKFPARQLVMPFLDCCIYVLFGVLVLRRSRFGASFGFGWYLIGMLCNFDYIMKSGPTQVFFMACTLCVLQGMRATYYLYKYEKSGEWIPDEDVHEVIDADFEFIETQDNQSKGQSRQPSS